MDEGEKFTPPACDLAAAVDADVVECTVPAALVLPLGLPLGAESSSQHRSPIFLEMHLLQGRPVTLTSQCSPSLSFCIRLLLTIIASHMTAFAVQAGFGYLTYLSLFTCCRSSLSLLGCSGRRWSVRIGETAVRARNYGRCCSGSMPNLVHFGLCEVLRQSFPVRSCGYRVRCCSIARVQ